MFKIKPFFLLLLFFCSLKVYTQDFGTLKCKGDVPNSIINYTIGNIDQGISEKFIVEYEYALRTIFRSGKVLFGDSLTNYVTKCADYIYDKNKKLNVATEFFVLKNTTPNAFAFPNGFIFVTTGLLGQIENEAQLCFILAHEIAHVQEKHGWESFNDRSDILRGKGNYKDLSLDERINLALRKSKTHELEADVEGYKIFKELGYNNNQVLRAFDMLLYSYLPFDEIDFDYHFLSDSLFVFPAKYREFKFNVISAAEEEDDEELTHPNVNKRKLAIINIAKDPGSEKVNLLGEAYFYNIQKLARFENLYLQISSGLLDKALYNVFLIEKTYGKSLYAAKVKNYALVNQVIAKIDANLNSSDFRMGTKEVQGNTQSVNYLLKKMTLQDAIIVSKRELLLAKRAYGADFFTELNQVLDKSAISKWNAIYPNFFLANQGILKKAGTSKIDKLKTNKIGNNTKDSSNHISWSFYLLNPNEEEMIWLGMNKDNSLSIIQDSDNDKEMEDDDDEYYRTKAGGKSRNTSSNAGNDEKSQINNVLILKPSIVRVKETTRSVKMDKFSDEELSNRVLQSIAGMTQDFSGSFSTLDPISGSNISIEEYNKYAFIKQWMYSHNNG